MIGWFLSLQYQLFSFDGLDVRVNYDALREICDQWRGWRAIDCHGLPNIVTILGLFTYLILFQFKCFWGFGNVGGPNLCLCTKFHYMGYVFQEYQKQATGLNCMFTRVLSFFLFFIFTFCVYIFLFFIFFTFLFVICLSHLARAVPFIRAVKSKYSCLHLV